MRVEALVSAEVSRYPQGNGAAEQVDRSRREALQAVEKPEQAEQKVAPEEILNKIKDITENGLYSVRFETDKDTHKMVVRLVDQKSGEVIRQLPPEELLELSQSLSEWRGNIIDTES